METLFVWIIGILASPLIVIFLLELFLNRKDSSHDRKMAYEQAQLDKKYGKNTLISQESNKRRKSVFYLVMGAVVVIIALLLFWLWPLKSPSAEDIWDLTKNYWFALSFLLIMLYLITSLFPEEKKGVAKFMQGTILFAGIVLFVIAPVLTWILEEGPKYPKSSKNSLPQETRLLLPPGGTSGLIPVPLGGKIRMSGSDFRYHCVYRDGHEESYGENENPCRNGDLPFVYAQNIRKDKPNMVVYQVEKAR